MSNDKVRSVELDLDQFLMILDLCVKQMVQDLSHGCYNPVLANTTVELFKAMGSQPKDDAKEQIPR